MPVIRRKFKFMTHGQTLLGSGSEFTMPGYFGSAVNLDIKYTPYARTRRSSTRYTSSTPGITSFPHSSYFFGQARWYLGAGTNFQRLLGADGAATATTLRAGLNGNRLAFAAMPTVQGVTGDYLFVSGGGLTNGFFKLDAAEVFSRWGIAPPATAAAAAIGAAGIPNGTYQYYITFTSITATESNPNPLVAITVVNQQVNLSSIPISADPQVTARNIYRTVGNGATPFLLTTIADNVTTVFVDNIADTALQPIELSFDNIDPSGSTLDFRDHTGPHAGRMWWARPAASAGFLGRVYYSRVGRAESVEGFIELSGSENSVRKIVIWNGSLWAFTNNLIYEIVGFDAPFTFRPVYGSIGTDKAWTIVPTPYGLCFLSRDDVIYRFDGTSLISMGTREFGRIFSGLTEFPSIDIADAGTYTKTTAATQGCAGYGTDEYFISDGLSPGFFGVVLNDPVGIKIRRLRLAEGVVNGATTIHTNYDGQIGIGWSNLFYRLEDSVNSGVGLEGVNTPDYIINYSVAFTDIDKLGVLQRVIIDAQIPVVMLLSIFDEDGTNLQQVTLPTSTARTSIHIPIGKVGRVFRIRFVNASGVDDDTRKVEIYSVEAEYYVPNAPQTLELR